MIWKTTLPELSFKPFISSMIIVNVCIEHLAFYNLNSVVMIVIWNKFKSQNNKWRNSKLRIFQWPDYTFRKEQYRNTLESVSITKISGSLPNGDKEFQRTQ